MRCGVCVVDAGACVCCVRRGVLVWGLLREGNGYEVIITGGQASSVITFHVSKSFVITVRFCKSETMRRERRGERNRKLMRHITCLIWMFVLLICTLFSP